MQWRLPAWIREPIRAKLRDILGWLILKNYLVTGSDRSQLKIADTATVANTFFTLSSGSVTVEDHVLFGYNVCIFTGTHDYTKFNEARALGIPSEGRDILIKQGAWIGSNATILGPCIIGEHAVVAARALVNKDVPPYTIVGGVPAHVIKTITVADHHSTQVKESVLSEIAANS